MGLVPMVVTTGAGPVVTVQLLCGVTLTYKLMQVLHQKSLKLKEKITFF